MSLGDRRWNELQTRWARGDSLSLEEDEERRAYAQHDALARRELELFAALRARGESPPEPVSAALVARALDGLKTAPHLRLVTASHDEADEQPAPRRARLRPKRVAAGALLIAGSAVAAFFISSGQRSAAPTAALRVAPPSSPTRAELVLAAGQVSVGDEAPRLGQRLLAQGQRISTAEGRACFTVEPGIDVCLPAHSAIELDSLTAPNLRVRVISGTALAALTPRAEGTSFALVTDQVTATAHGTTYALRGASDEAEVIVLEGQVAVARGGAAAGVVDAHSRLVVPTSGAFRRTAVGRSEEARLLSLRATHPLWNGVAGGVLELAAEPSTGQASVDEQGPLPLPVQVFVSAGMHRVGWRDATGDELSSWIEVGAGETRRVARPEPAKPIASEAISKPSPATLLERARRELSRAEPHQALALYEQLRSLYPTSAEARTVLITMGKLELELGQPRRALGHFEAYQRSGGALMPEALAGQARALRALGRAQEERRALQQYLAAHPKGFEAPLFAKRLRELSQP